MQRPRALAKPGQRMLDAAKAGQAAEPASGAAETVEIADRY